MIPLLPDPFYVAMAITIIFGLLFATGLTMIVVPTLYTLFYRVKATASE
jgi:multidrug efflux pump subunit AcrB